VDIHIDSSGLIAFLGDFHTKSEDDQGGFVTTKQICDKLGISDKKAYSIIRRLKDEGLVEHGHVWITSIDNKRVRSNGYRLKPQS
jgi:Mn-dependent DtxR family transcriptional regulator